MRDVTRRDFLATTGLSALELLTPKLHATPADCTMRIAEISHEVAPGRLYRTR
jgi:hypothetical protein